ncbi:transglycosylase SLT domain-containing protein [Marilutibacter chinensis]|uniref:Transglycosylase SLT domain-containing protein n=1 Tax=Marilutibacter chinensis TaxID=2912247 RepID=A0ABS9HTW6_9GAMM|nr:transglycosylase SLT domain-containing protein [Lysobacter chinensis]MCF7222148.1 transglycosylase SLT domain-containing protein [Lysobacter chinensis]
MIASPSLHAALALTLIALATSACAQSAPAPASATPATDASPSAVASTLEPLHDPHLARVGAAIEAAEAGRFRAVEFRDLANHPLFAWIEYASLRRGLDGLPTARARDFLERHAGTPAAETFRHAWLIQLARREDWNGFLADWHGDTDDTTLACHKLHAEQALGRAGGDWNVRAQAIWSRTGESLPKACDAVFDALAARGGLGADMRWQRFDKAADAWQPGVMRSIARGLPADQQALANDYAAFIDAPHARALDWPKTERSRRVASQGLARLGKADPDRAEQLLPQYAQALRFDQADRGRALYQIALWTVASYLPDSARRLNAVPDASYDPRLHEWRVREALSRSDWSAALAAIRKMDAEQRAESRWRYFEARLAEKTGDRATAQRLYRQAATESDFHGFLAADRAGLPYTLCPWQPRADAAAIAKVTGDPALRRAVSLARLERAGWAVAEWKDALSRFSDAERLIAVEYAQANGWFDRAVFGLQLSNPDERRLYDLRFPLHHDATIRREAAKNRLDPAWVAAEIRAESTFNPRARSSANALGLMQILPGTGAATAARLGLPWGGAASLYDADTNIILGSAYLRQMMDENGGQPYFAIAGYNAGPTPLLRWRTQRPGMDPDFWIETVSYRETREYIARVLAFSVIYDWKLDGDALRLEDRIRGRTQGPRKGFVCAATDAQSAAVREDGGQP